MCLDFHNSGVLSFKMWGHHFEHEIDLFVISIFCKVLGKLSYFLGSQKAKREFYSQNPARALL